METARCRDNRLGLRSRRRRSRDPDGRNTLLPRCAESRTIDCSGGTEHAALARETNALDEFETAVADYNAQNFEQAEKNARAAMKVNPPDRNPRASQLLGFILLNKRDLAGAREALREYVKLAPGAKDLTQMKAQLAEIEGRLEGNSLDPDPGSTKQP